MGGWASGLGLVEEDMKSIDFVREVCNFLSKVLILDGRSEYFEKK